jgi:hypothetical protein
MFVGDSQMGSTAFTAANEIKSVANSARGFVAKKLAKPFLGDLHF